MQEFTGSGANLTVTETKIIIKRQGFSSWILHGSKGDKEIFIKNITAIQLKKPGFTNGFIQFSVSGESASKGGVVDATKDENSIIITASQYESFVKAKDLIESYIIRATIPKVEAVPAYSLADEIRKLADLKEEGFLTDEEFQIQKRKLLG